MPDIRSPDSSPRDRKKEACLDKTNPSNPIMPRRDQDPSSPYAAAQIKNMVPSSSISATSGSLFSVSSPSHSSSPPSAIDGNARFGVEDTSTRRIIKKRPRINDLQKPQSTSKLPLDSQFPSLRRSESPSRTHRKRRCVSADPISLRRTRFLSPDRFAGFRTKFEGSDSPIRTSRDPNLLNDQERRFRSRDKASNPFRSTSYSRSRALIKSQSGQGYGTIPHYVPSFVNGLDALPAHDSMRSAQRTIRHVSLGGVWAVGGRIAAFPTPLHGVETGAGDLFASGSVAPMLSTQFLDTTTEEDQLNSHETRLGLALDIDPANRVLPVTNLPSPVSESPLARHSAISWRDGAWTRQHDLSDQCKRRSSLRVVPEKVLPTIAFRVLDAPRLKDDYYCSVLAYSFSCRTLAVALNHRVYLWREKQGVRHPPLMPARPTNYVSALAFSSEMGGKAILAVARNSGHVTLWSLYEQRPRFEAPHPWSACCVAFRPVAAHRQSVSSAEHAPCEDLLVGDDSGCLYYYSLEWPDFTAGSMTLLVKLDAHSQNICGLAWSPDGTSFVTGGNDNTALLFHTETVLDQAAVSNFEHSRQGTERGTDPATQQSVEIMEVEETQRPVLEIGGTDMQDINGQRGVPEVPEVISLPTPPSTPPHVQTDRGRSSIRMPLQETQPHTQSETSRSQPALNNHLASSSVEGRRLAHKQAFYHSAAVKAIAYAPWQPTLLATGGGSNDRQIHFHHTESGSTLAVINVFAQVTSLIWSTTRREIAATFGYAQPEHDTRIAVFAWPSCDCVVSIPWERKLNGEIGRVLWAIPYPGGPNDATMEREVETETREGFEV